MKVELWRAGLWPEGHSDQMHLWEGVSAGNIGHECHTGTEGLDAELDNFCMLWTHWNSITGQRDREMIQWLPQNKGDTVKAVVKSHRRIKSITKHQETAEWKVPSQSEVKYTLPQNNVPPLPWLLSDLPGYVIKGPVPLCERKNTRGSWTLGCTENIHLIQKTSYPCGSVQ